MKKLIGLFLLVASTAWAGVPTPATTPFTRDLLRSADADAARTQLGIVNSNWTVNTAQFETPGNNLQIKSGSTQTNVALAGTVTYNGVNISNLIASYSVVDVTASPWLADKSGVASSTTNIQGAINFAVYSNNAPVALKFPRGKYLLTNELTVPSMGDQKGIVFLGEGSGASKLVLDKTNAIALRFAYAASPGYSRNVRVQGLWISGPLANTGWPGNGTSTMGIQGGDPATAASGSGWAFEDLRIDGFEYGLVLSNIWYPSIDHCYFTSNRLVSVKLSPAYVPSIKNSQFRGPGPGWTTDTHLLIDQGLTAGVGASGVAGEVKGCIFIFATNAVIQKDASWTYENVNWERCHNYLWTIGGAYARVVGCDVSELWQQSVDDYGGSFTFVTNNHPAWFQADGTSAKGWQIENLMYEDDGYLLAAGRPLFWAYPTNHTLFSWNGLSQWLPSVRGGWKDSWTGMWGPYLATTNYNIYRDSLASPVFQMPVIITNTANIANGGTRGLEIVNGSLYSFIFGGDYGLNSSTVNKEKLGAIGYFPYGRSSGGVYPPAMAMSFRSYTANENMLMIGGVVGDTTNGGPSEVYIYTSTNPAAGTFTRPTWLFDRNGNLIQQGWSDVGSNRFVGNVGQATNSVGTKIDDFGGGVTAQQLIDATNDLKSATASGAYNIWNVGVDAAKILSNTVPTARLGSGTANSSTYLRGDQTWQALPGGGDVSQTAQNNFTGSNSMSGALYSSATTNYFDKLAAGVLYGTGNSNYFAGNLGIGGGLSIFGGSGPTYVSDLVSSNRVQAYGGAASLFDSVVLSNITQGAILIGGVTNKIGPVAPGSAGYALVSAGGTSAPYYTNTVPSAASATTATGATYATNDPAGVDLRAYTKTNDTRALTLTGPVNIGILNITNNITNSVLTGSRLVLSDANKALTSAAASGAVPVDADGSATTIGQLQALAVVASNDTRTVTLVNGSSEFSTNTATTGNNTITMDMLKAFSLLSTNIATATLSLANVPTSSDRCATLILSNSAASGTVEITTSGFSVLTNGMPSAKFWVTNNSAKRQVTHLTVNCYGGFLTNAIVTHFYEP